MKRRGPIKVLLAATSAAALAALAVLGGVQAANAGAPALTWQQAAARLHAPVYRPSVTVRLKQQPLVINQGGCLIGAWGAAKTQKGPHFSIDEPGDTSQCGQPGEADQVATTVIHGKKVTVLVQCRHIPHCTVHDGETDGVFIIFVPEKGAKQYVIQLGSSHLSLRNLEKVARSFVRVNAPHSPAARSAASAAVHHFGDFLSPDRKVWCGAGATTFCATGGDPSAPPHGPQTLGSLAATGRVTICRVAHASVSSVCTQNWDDTAPVLGVGQSTERNNIRCASAANGISCAMASGPEKGRGFRISATGVTRIGPGGPPPAPVPVLGDARAGLGTARPRLIALGNDIIGHVSNVKWRNWGAAQASATGTGYWVPSGKPESDARAAPAKIVAFDLGACHGVRAYRKLEWWLPSRGGNFSARGGFSVCL